MSNTPAARKRNAWLPNRMFDPVSNPFAIQNLLDRHESPFAAEPDDRPDDAFGIDTLASGVVIKAFEVNSDLQLPDEDFAVDSAVSGEFAADDTLPDAEFDAAEAADMYAAFTAGLDDELDSQPLAAEAVAATEAQATDSDAALAEAEATLSDVIPVAESQAELETTPEVIEAAQADDEVEAMAETPVAAIVEEASTESEAVAEPAAQVAPEMTAEPEIVTPAEPDLTSEALTQMVEAARADAYAQGLDTGRGEGREAERPLAHKQGYDEGFTAGVAQAKAETQSDEQKRQQQAHQAKLDQLQAVIDNLQQLAYNPDAMFEPMKKLAVYLAEQLVRGELTQSPQAISRLVDNALRELNSSGDKAVVIHLNPEDLEAYRPTVANFADSLILRPDTKLERGSVRVSLDGSVVEDLMQRRADGLKKSLSQAPAPGWRAGGNTLATRVQQGQPVDDVTIIDNKDKTGKTLETAAPADDHA